MNFFLKIVFQIGRKLFLEIVPLTSKLKQRKIPYTNILYILLISLYTISNMRGAKGVGASQSMGAGIGLSSSRAGGVGGSRRGGGANNNGGVAIDGNRPQLVDALGRNVTPKPLVGPKDTSAATGGGEKRPATNANIGTSRASDASDYNDNMSAGGFSEDSVEEGEEGEDEQEEKEIEEEEKQKGGGGGTRNTNTKSGRAPQQQREKLTDAELEALITLSLSETETSIIFSMPALRAMNDTPAAKLIQAANDRYDAVCATILKSGSEIYPARAVQTLNKSTKNKEIGAVPPSSRSTEAQVDSWNIADMIREAANDVNTTNTSSLFTVSSSSSSSSSGASQLEKVVDAMVSVSLATPGCLIDADAAVNILPANLTGGGNKSKASSSTSSGALTSTTNAAAATSSSSSSSSSSTANTASVSSSSSKAGTSTKAATAAATTTSPSKGWGRDSTSSTASDSSTSSRRGSSGGGAIGAGSGVTKHTTSTGTDAGVGPDGSSSSTAGGGTTTSAAAAIQEDGAGPLDVVVQQQANRILKSHGLLDSLSMVERAIQQNLYHQSHRKYRSGPAQDLLDTLLNAGLTGGHLGAAAVLQAHSNAMIAAAAAANEGGGAGAGGKAKHHIEGSAEEAQADAEAAAVSAAGRAANGAEGQDPTEDAANEGGGDDDEEEAEAAEEEESASGGEKAAAGGGAGGDGGASGPGSGSSIDAETLAKNSLAAVLVQPKPGLLRLWTYKCPAVQGLNVTGMAWNHANRDLLAVSYGPYEFAEGSSTTNNSSSSSSTNNSNNNSSSSSEKKGGCIALWNLSNPEHPQAILSTPEGTGATSLDFSKKHPSFLAAGMYNGCVCVYDVAAVLTGKSDGRPGLVSETLAHGAHTEAVWQVKWVAFPDSSGGGSSGGGGANEGIVSVSTDGKVTHWSIKKGLTPTLLMLLKRAKALAPGDSSASSSSATKETNATTKDGNATTSTAAAPASTDALGATGSEGLLSRTASGLAFDFPADDTSQYLVGTDEGLLARCSVSYTEQYLDVTQAHSGAINRLKLSPFLPQACITASSDWSLRLWSMDIGIHSGSSSTNGRGRKSGGGGGGGGGVGGPKPVTYTTDEVHDAVTDVAWSPSISTRFASVTRDGHVQVWDASQLSPVLDTVVSVDEEEWRAIQAKMHADREALLKRMMKDELDRRRAAQGGELDEEEDSEARVLMLMRKKLAQEENMREIANGGGASSSSTSKTTSKSGAGGGKHNDDDDDDDDDAKSVDSEAEAAPKPTKAAAAGHNHRHHDHHHRQPPRKKFSSVLFADNTHVLLTGDSSGNVDVYRLVGLGAPGGGEEDLLGGGGGISAPVVGSEEYEMQLEALQAVLQNLQ